MIGIYKITSPSGKIYIGQSRNVEKRIKHYKVLDCKEQPAIYNSLLKYGVELHQFEIIEECLFEDLNVRERYWQDYYDVLKHGLNCNLTETDVLPKVVSEETRLKIGNYHRGKKQTDETKLKIKIARKKQILSKDHMLKANQSNMIKVIDINTKIIYNSINEAAEVNNISSVNLGRYLSGKRKNKTNLRYYNK